MEVQFTEAKIPAPPKQRDIKPAPAPEPAAAPAAAATPPAAAPAAPPAAPSRKTPTVDELNARSQEVYDSMDWGKAPEIKPGDVPPSDEAPEAAAAAPAAAPATEPAAEPEPEPELTVSQTISATARETAREVAKALGREPQAAAPAAPAPESGFEMNPQDTADLEVMRYMEQNDPKMVGIAQKFMDWVKAHYDYVTAWTEANPDKEYNPDDQEHVAFYAKQPQFDEQAMEDARIDMRAERKIEQRQAPERERKKAAEAFERELPAIAQRIDMKSHALICKMSPELGKLITGANGESNITTETLALLDAQDPIAREIANEIILTELEPLALELEKIAIPELKYPFNPNGNAIHAQIAQFLGKQEQEMAKAPKSVQMRNGAQWITLREYNTRLNSIRGSNSNQAQKDALISGLDRDFWTLTVDMAQDLIVDHCAAKAKERLAKQDNLARKKYVRENPVAAAPAAAPAPAARPAPVAGGRTATGKPISPSVGQSAVSTAGQTGGIPQKTFGEQAVDVQFSR